MEINPSLLASARKQFYDIIDRFSETEKSAYVEATIKCPNLILLESNPDFYLESSNYDPFTAALRVLEYWSLRRSWFGEERAFLPMTITGEGALTNEDIEVLNTGFMMLLPEDNFGRGVVFHDRARLTCPEVMDVGKRKRAIFYVLSVAGESERVRKNGLVFLSAFCDKTRKSTFDLQMLSDKVSLMKKEILPYHFVGMHIVMLSQRPILNMVVPTTLQVFEEMNCLKRGIVVHSRKPPEQLLEDFKNHGFDPESIPKVPFHGYWTLGCFKRWIQERLLKEKKVYESGGVPSLAAEEGAGAGLALNAGCKVEEDYGEQLRKKRKMGAAYARRKRARNKIETEVMQNEVERLKRQKTSLEQESTRLQGLLAEARSEVERIEDDPELLAQATAVPITMVQNPLQEEAPPPVAESSTAAGQDDSTGLTPDPQYDMHFLRQFMSSFVQPDLTNHFPMSGPFQTLVPQPVPPPLPAATAHQMLLSLLAGGGSIMNNQNTYMASPLAPGILQQQSSLYQQNQDQLFRTLCGAFGNGDTSYSDSSPPSTHM